MKKKNTATKGISAASPPSEMEIAALAHSYWEAEGRPDGSEWSHWLRAEADLIAASKAGRERQQ